MCRGALWFVEAIGRSRFVRAGISTAIAILPDSLHIVMLVDRPSKPIEGRAALLEKKLQKLATVSGYSGLALVTLQ
jgi:hypothetical protein